MAALIDSLGNLDHAVRRKFKKVFAQLGDDYIVRTPAQPNIQVADLLIEGPNRHWLLLGLHSSEHSSHHLNKYRSLSLVLKRAHNTFLRYLAISEPADLVLDVQDKTLPHLLVVEFDDFLARGAALIQHHCHGLTDNTHKWLKKHIFPETNINAEFSTRRDTIERNNGAQLQEFFLDYDQEKATKLDIIGEDSTNKHQETQLHSVRLINGVAGCGKTLILINRAILYCKHFPKRKVLLLIHNKPITRDIEYKFRHHLGGIPANLTIKTFHAFALSQKNRVSARVKPLFGEKTLLPFKQQILGNHNSLRNKLNLSDAKLWSEIEYINEHLIENSQHYLSIERQGRGFSLKKTQRQAVWKLYEQAMKLMADRDGYLPSLYIRELCFMDPNDSKLDNFDHILLDEAQFFYPSWLQLALKSLRTDGQLFMCADPNQGFLKTRMSWKSIGLNVRGRTQMLNYSYRTTYEILRAANALLEELDTDNEDFIKPQLVNMQRGSKPRVIYSDTLQDELKRFLNELKQIVELATFPLHHIMVLCGDDIGN
nr:AAA family ATPase [Cellvibrionaceae bacterium]